MKNFSIGGMSIILFQCSHSGESKMEVLSLRPYQFYHFCVGVVWNLSIGDTMHCMGHCI